MKKITSKKLSERLTKYGALTMAIAGVTEGNSQNVVHVDLAPNYFNGGVDSIDGTPTYQLYLDPGSILDFSIRGIGSVTNPLAQIQASPGFNSFVASASGYPMALNPLDPINSTQDWSNANPFGILNAGCFNNSNWCDVTDRYLGLRFRIGVDTHYGWVKLDVNASGSRFTVKEYAYMDQKDLGLTAGQTTLDINEESFSNIKVITSDKSIGFYNLQGPSTYKIHNITGNTVLNGKADQGDAVIDVPNLAGGIYIIELADAKSNAVIRKKVVLR